MEIFRFLHNLEPFYYEENVKTFDLKKNNNKNEIKLCASVVTTNGFALNHDKTLLIIYFFWLKCQAEKQKTHKKKTKKTTTNKQKKKQKTTTQVSERC